MNRLNLALVAASLLVGATWLSCSGPDGAEPVDDVAMEKCSPEECDDFNPCTLDKCGLDGACVNSPDFDRPCDDGSACTMDDRCSAEAVCMGGETRTCPGDDECLSEGTCVAESGCVYEPIVDDAECDGNPCTKTNCDDTGTCVTSNMDGEAECDADPCTQGDVCGNGNCTSGELVKCDDANPDDCTFPICNSETGLCDLTENRDEGQPCKDGNACTDDDACDADGNCEAGETVECVSLTPCKTAYCDKNKKEGTDACVEEWLPADTGCDDGSACTTEDTCIATGEGDALKCAGQPLVCDDGSSCTNDTCDEKDGCKYVPLTDGTLCDLPPNFCGEKGKCLEGDCQDNDVVVCDDSIACTVDTCDGGECKHAPDHSACDDANVCTDDSCETGSGCVFTPKAGEVEGESCCEEAENCDDGNACTADTCNDLWHCAFEPLTGTVCDDGLFCTIDDVCTDGLCGGAANPCSDEIECTVDTCDDDQDACLNATDDAACDDEVACTVNSCDAELGCQFATDDTLCTDNIDCTTDTCDAELGCQFAAVDGECNDGLTCTADSCSAETGCVFAPLGGIVDGTDCCIEEDEECDDGNQCTEDTCNLDTNACEVANKDDGDACDDGIKCTDDECQAGHCVGEAKACDDQIECTIDSCNEADGCVNAPDDDACDDQVPCTNDTCDAQDGCEFVPDNDICADAFECTYDACDPKLGCLNLANDDGCNDDVGCTVDSCDELAGCKNEADNGLCDEDNPCFTYVCDVDTDCKATYSGGSFDIIVCCEEEDAECSDGIPCTKDTCNLETHQCEASAMANGQACTPNDLCKNQGTCDGGDCVASDKVCNDNVPCTGNDCDPDTGCFYTTDDAFCADDNDCTAETCDANNGCDYQDLDGQDCDDGDPKTVDDTCVQDLCQGVFEGPLTGLVLYEPCADISPAFKGGQCAEGGPAYDDLSSSWQRTDEPFELPLVNGILEASVLGYWKLDGDEADSSFGGSDGSAIGEVVPGYGAFGDANGAMNFDGETSYVSAPSSSIAWGNEVTVMAWVRFESLESVQSVFEVWKTGENFGINIFYSNGSLRFQVHTPSSGGNYQLTLPTDGLVVPGQWVHLAHVFDGNNQAAYVDGRMVDSQAGLNDTFGAPDENALLYIGSEATYGPGQRDLQGAVDDVLVFSRSLSPYEIAAYYQSRHPYGETLVPDAQADFDDVRVSENGQQVTHEIIGPRPHSDTPCPMNEDDGTWVDRDDLCGVEAYWKLDGDAVDVMGDSNGTVHEAIPTLGRFGDAQGAIRTWPGEYIATDYQVDLSTEDSVTVEAWARASAYNDTQTICGAEKGMAHFNLLIQTNAVVFEFFDAGYNGKAVKAAASLQDSRWHHYAAVRNTSADALLLYVDGILVAEAEDTTASSVKPNYALWLGVKHKDGGIEQYLRGAIDEIIIHNVAKSPDYIYRRANPGLPSVRFLVDTDEQPSGQTYPYKSYGLTWGEQNAKHEAPLVEDVNNANGGKPCVGLLSPCNGYAGWWRLNEASGASFHDDSTYAGIGTHSATTPAIIQGVENTAVDFSEHSVVATGDHLELSEFTAEATLKADKLQDAGIYGKIGAVGNGQYNYRLNSYGDGKLVANFEVGDQDCSVSVPGAYEAEEWISTAFAYDGQTSSFWRQYSDESTLNCAGPDLGSGSFHIGSGDGTPPHFEGIIDSVRIMNRALTADEFLHHPLTNAINGGFPCTPNCAGKDCGYDGCGGSCGECGEGEICQSGQCSACPSGMVELDGTPPMCIDLFSTKAGSKSQGIADCQAKGQGGHVCNVTEIDAAIAVGYKPDAGTYITTEGEKCCCPCGGGSDPRAHTTWNTTGPYCECWDMPWNPPHLCCLGLEG